jgi:hypothetical protein
MNGYYPGRWLARICAGLAIAAIGAPGVAQPMEQSVKAAFLTKFPRYVAWPPGARPAGRPVDLCVVGNDPFGRLIDQAAQSDPGAMIVRRVERAEQARDCAVAFLGGTRQQSAAQMVAVLQNQPVLTITDSRVGSGQGIIHFALRQGKVGFHINDALAARGRLSISSRLLQLALSVKQRS